MEPDKNCFDSADLFTGLAERYQAFRPSYPGRLLEELKTYIERRRSPSWPDRPMVYDVAAGTGILTRQLRSLLGGQFGVTGVEPNQDMRAAAQKNTPEDLEIDYVYGVAEHLPIPNEAASVIVVGQAAHWFDRARFYREVRRSLHADGVLAIIQNDRAWDVSALDDAYERFLEAASPGYTRDYRDFPISDELADANGFSEVTSHSVEWSRALTREQYLGACLSSTKVQKAIDKLGTEEVVNKLNNLMAPFLTSSGHVHVHYRSWLFLAVSDPAASKPR